MSNNVAHYYRNSIISTSTFNSIFLKCPEFTMWKDILDSYGCTPHICIWVRGKAHIQTNVLWHFKLWKLQKYRKNKRASWYNRVSYNHITEGHLNSVMLLSSALISYRSLEFRVQWTQNSQSTIFNKNEIGMLKHHFIRYWSIL